jgi:RNA polymerase sigma-70 factor, ECF subfamily
MSAIDTEQLVERLAAGEREALAAFFDRYAGRVHALAMRILSDADEAEDVVQEVFVQVWRDAARFDAQRGTPQAWVCTIARSRALDRLRRRTARREDPPESAPGASTASSTADEIAVRQALGELPEEQREALELAYYEGLTQSEIALRLAAPLGTIKTRMRSGLLRLRSRLGPAR